LEDISSQSDTTDFEEEEDPKEAKSLLGSNVPHYRREGEAVQRSRICSQVMEDVSPILLKWGVTLHNFQLESTKLADSQYAIDYEKASLDMARAKANFRTQTVQKKITLTQAEAQAEKQKITASGESRANLIRAQADADAAKVNAKMRAEIVLLEAKADAEARLQAARAAADSKRMEAQAAADAKRMEGQSRGDSANTMRNPFAQEIALKEQQVAALSALKINNLNLITNSGGSSGSWVDQMLPCTIAQNMTLQGKPD